MQEVPFTREDHRQAELVCPLDHRVVAHRATGLDDRGDARGRRGLDAVFERIERIARAGTSVRAAGARASRSNASSKRSRGCTSATRT